MESSILELEGATEATNQLVPTGIDELNQLQLAMVGGGCAEVCPY